MFTDVPGKALCVLVADCVPVLIADPAAGLVGAAHAGREGLVAGVVPTLVTAMIAAGASPARMRAVTGPAICGRCYEVPAEMQARVSAIVPDARCDTSAGTSGLDIAAGVRAQLASAGVAKITADGRCTTRIGRPVLLPARRDHWPLRRAGLADAVTSAPDGGERLAELAANLAAVRTSIAAACEAAGRSTTEVRLIAVTKTFPASDVMLLHRLGIADIGENKDQEAAPKVAACAACRASTALALRRAAPGQQGRERRQLRAHGALGGSPPAGRGAWPPGGRRRAAGALPGSGQPG